MNEIDFRFGPAERPLPAPGPARITVTVRATDPISHAGITSCLRSCAELDVVPAEDLTQIDVVVLAPAALSGAVLSGMRRAAGRAGKPVVLVIGTLHESDLLNVVECGVVAIVPRAAATAKRLVRSVRTAANGGGLMPSDVLGAFVRQVEQVQRDVLAPRGLTAAGLSPREVDVLRLISEGFDTAEIASKLRYSERTVLNIISGVTTRLQLRNRSHAVGYALRAGMI